MKIDLLPLINNRVDIIEIDEQIEIPEEYYKDTDIRKLSKIDVKGSIDDLGDNIFNLKIQISGMMVLPCALSLEDVEYPFEIFIDQNVGEGEEFEENYKINANILDILPLLWENIVLEKPNKVVKPNVKIKTEGDGWSLTDIKEESNNQLSELKKLLDMEE